LNSELQIVFFEKGKYLQVLTGAEKHGARSMEQNQRSEVRDQKSEVGGRKPEVKSQRADGRGQQEKIEDRKNYHESGNG
jgi:hypothetical protein